MDNKQATLELGTKPVGRLLMQYALPAIVAMVAASLYNMVDSIFIGQGVGVLAISGLAITFPFMNLSAAFGAAIGVGSSTFISVKLGQRDYAIANKVLGNCVMLNVIVGILFGGICLLFLDPILGFFGASENTIPYAREYMQVILVGNAFTHLYFGLNAVLRSASKPRQAMYATIFTVVINSILDPIFIYVLGLGIRGAAYATILSQILALCWQWKLFSNKDELLHFDYSLFRINKQIVKNIVGIGMSPFAMNSCACLVVIFINKCLMAHGGDLAVGAYGIANRIAFIFVMVTMGVNQGMQPIAGYNYGAQNYDRLRKVVKLAILCATVVCTVGFLVAMFGAYPCARLFTKDESLIEIAETAIRMMMMVFPIVGYQIVVTNFFQSIGKAKVSMFLSLSRQLIFLVPALAIFSEIWGLWGVWASMPFSDALATIVAAVMMKRSSVWKN
ncbi:MAG: MATE family efflux transporter [Prevotellaceae bacterium]|nr:MATE family efflux transporter [Prevotellaceae bacterium]